MPEDVLDVLHYADLTEIMASSRNYKQLLFVWDEWHKAAGVPLKSLFKDFVEVSNRASQADGKNFLLTFDTETTRSTILKIPN